MNKKEKTVQRRSVAFSPDQLEQLEKLAAKQNTTASELIRRFIDKGLSVQGYQDNIGFISGIVRQEVKAEISTQIERLVKILMKVGIITSSNYFLSVRMLSDVISPSMQEDFKDINTNARRLGVDYMKLKDYDVISFMEDDSRVSAAVNKLKTNLTEDNY